MKGEDVPKMFDVYPAIDLRNGQVVRLRTGDPGQQTTYSVAPADAAREWCGAGARWLHVVNLDGAFGESGRANWQAVQEMITIAQEWDARVQFGGGLRSLEALNQAFDLGAARVVLGTALIESPDLFAQAVNRYGGERIVAGVDARSGAVQVRGWQQDGGIRAVDLAKRIAGSGVKWMVYTDISRDGTGRGANLAETAALAKATGLQVIASGGFDRADEVLQARKLGLAGVILGRALYEHTIDLRQVIELVNGGEHAG